MSSDVVTKKYGDKQSKVYVYVTKAVMRRHFLLALVLVVEVGVVVIVVVL
jgi:hypothetical protein